MVEQQVSGYDSKKDKDAITACYGDGRHNVSHEWEELLYKLSLTEDPKMRDFACQEMAKIRTTTQGVRFFDLGKIIL